MNTILINCSKDKSKVQDENGRFINEVSQGIEVNVGDRISLEGIAVNSVGVGNDVIEIPKKVKGWKYKPNAIELEVGFYINHNHRYTIKLPMLNYQQIYTPADNAKYGYLSKFQQAPQANLDTLYTIDNYFPLMSGAKMYLLECVKEVGDLETIPIAYGALPYERLYKRQTSKLRLEVPNGYDSPQNIAKNLTQQFSKTNYTPVPQRDSLQAITAPAFSIPNNQSDYENYSVSYDKGTTRILPCNWYGYTQGLINRLIGDENLWYSGLATSNPCLWEYGSRLLIPFYSIKSLSYIAHKTSGTYYDTDIYYLYDPPIVNADIDWNDGYVLTTSLKWDMENLRNVAEFIHSQKLWNGGGNDLTTSEMKLPQNLVYFETEIDMGRGDDSNPGVPGQTENALEPPCYLPTTANYTAGNALRKLYPKTLTFYNKNLYNQRYLGANAITEGAILDGDEVILNTDIGEEMKSEQLAKYFNANLVCIKTAQGGGGQQPQYNIGIVMKSYQGNTGIKPGGRNYCLIDLAFCLRKNLTCALVNPNKLQGQVGTNLADYSKIIQVGSPNGSIVFDGDKGRFGFSNLHWATRVGSGTQDEAVPGADGVVMTINTSIVRYGTQQAGITKPYIRQSWSGITLEGVSLYDENFNTTRLVGDKFGKEFNPIDWDKCLLGRLGFEYNQLFSKYGLPYVNYNKLFYESGVPVVNPQLFPTPLSTNAEFDTSTALGLSVNIHSLPMYDLNVEANYTNIVMGVNSCIIYAKNLATKLEFPYWLVYSDIIEGMNFHSVEDGEKNNIIAVCNRAYISGDFAFSFATDYVFTATKDFVISGITTQILNPDLSPADIDDRTSVIYKIQKPIPMFQVDIQDINKPKKVEDYENKRIEEHKRNPIVDRKDRTETSRRVNY